MKFSQNYIHYIYLYKELGHFQLFTLFIQNVM